MICLILNLGRCNYPNNVNYLLNIFSNEDFIEAIKLLKISELKLFHTRNANIINLYPESRFNIPKIACRCEECMDVYIRLRHSVKFEAENHIYYTPGARYNIIHLRKLPKFPSNHEDIWRRVVVSD